MKKAKTHTLQPPDLRKSRRIKEARISPKAKVELEDTVKDLDEFDRNMIELVESEDFDPRRPWEAHNAFEYVRKNLLTPYVIKRKSIIEQEVRP